MGSVALPGQTSWVEGDDGKSIMAAETNRAIDLHSTKALDASCQAVEAASCALFGSFDDEILRVRLSNAQQAAEDVVSELRAMEHTMEAEESKKVRAGWQNLLRGATKTTTKRAFQASQLPASVLAPREN